jgi:hypothetical protein
MGLSNQTETRGHLTGVHLCCGGCVDAVALVRALNAAGFHAKVRE